MNIAGDRLSGNRAVRTARAGNQRGFDGARRADAVRGLQVDAQALDRNSTAGRNARPRIQVGRAAVVTGLDCRRAAGILDVAVENDAAARLNVDAAAARVGASKVNADRLVGTDAVLCVVCLEGLGDGLLVVG